MRQPRRSIKQRQLPSFRRRSGMISKTPALNPGWVETGYPQPPHGIPACVTRKSFFVTSPTALLAGDAFPPRPTAAFNASRRPQSLWCAPSSPRSRPLPIMKASSCAHISETTPQHGLATRLQPRWKPCQGERFRLSRQKPPATSDRIHQRTRLGFFQSLTILPNPFASKFPMKSVVTTRRHCR